MEERDVLLNEVENLAANAGLDVTDLPAEQPQGPDEYEEYLMPKKDHSLGAGILGFALGGGLVLAASQLPKFGRWVGGKVTSARKKHAEKKAAKANASRDVEVDFVDPEPENEEE